MRACACAVQYQNRKWVGVGRSLGLVTAESRRKSRRHHFDSVANCLKFPNFVSETPYEYGISAVRPSSYCLKIN